MSNEIAQTILAQLGGGKFRAMTGAKQFLCGPSMLQFDLPARFAKNRATKVRIDLDANDEYTVTFFRWVKAKLECVQLSKHDGVQVSNLREIFTRETGLDCTL